ncbi:MAG: hypothetical protein KKE24_06945 [Candidatus Thermoplasmatota archaeon]|nr:hypothetical protein [Candidatus Thermoplasmatota archaeon]
MHVERVLRTSVAPLDRLVGGFRASELVLFEGDTGYASTLLHLLCVKAVHEFDEEVVWIDGGNTVDPYSISALCKKMRMDKRDVLSRVNISRAFTAYQLVTLIDEKLEQEIIESTPAVVIVSSLTDLFQDKDMKWAESYQLLRRCVDDIRRMTQEHETISFVTDHTAGYGRTDNRLTALIRVQADRVIHMKEKKDGTVFNLPKEGRSTLFHPVPWNQSTLDEYGGDHDGEDGAYISPST